MTAPVPAARPDRNRIAEVIYDLISDHPMWIDGNGQGLDYSPERESRIGDFVYAAADALVPLLATVRDEAAADAWHQGYAIAEHDALYWPYSDQPSAATWKPTPNPFRARTHTEETNQ